MTTKESLTEMHAESIRRRPAVTPGGGGQPLPSFSDCPWERHAPSR